MRNEFLSEIRRIVTRSSAFANLLLGKSISERVIGDCLGHLFRRNGYRIAARVSPWKLIGGLPAGSRKAVSRLKSYRHPLHPDIDILIEDSSHELWGNELKLIRWREEPPDFVIPKARLYDGLGQVLAVATCGVDYACLWHVFVPPMAAYRRLEARSPRHAEKIDDERIEFVAAYTGIIRGLLEHFELPIGYIALAVFADEATRTVRTTPLLPWTEPTRLPPTPTGTLVRSLLLKALGTWDA
jgi:hypothetical protein